MDYFEKEAEYYLNLYSFDLYQRFYLTYRQRKAVSSLTERGRVLDVGCGPGKLLKELSKLDIPLTGCDKSKKMIEIARENFRGRLVQADAVSLPFRNNSFDFVFCLGVLPYMKEPLAGVREIYRVLSKNGKTCISYPYKKTPLAFFREDRIGIWIRKHLLKLAHYQVKYRREEFIKAIEKIGFEVLSEERLFLSEFLLVLGKLS